MHISHGPYPRKHRGPARTLFVSNDVAEKTCHIIKETYKDDPSAAKSAARDANVSPRAAENWFAGKNPMSLTAFLNAFHGNPTFRAHARKVLFLEHDLDPGFQAALYQLMLAAARHAQLADVGAP